jgi:hypothetical protein
VPARRDIALNYDPGLQPIITAAAWGFFACAAILACQFGLIITLIPLLQAAARDDWASVLPALNASPWPFLLTKLNFLAMRCLYVVSVLGFGAACWRGHKSAALAMAGFTVVSLPISLLCQASELQLLKLAQSYAAATTALVRATIMLQASTLYGTAEAGDIFVNLVPFNGVLIAWLLIARRPPHPRWLAWVIGMMIILPAGRAFGHPMLGLANMLPAELVLLYMGSFMRRLRPLAAN